MSIASTDLILYCAQNMPTSDSGTSGGAIETTTKTRPVFTTGQIPGSTGTAVEVASNGTSDGDKKVRITGRLATGVIDTEDINISASANTFTTGAKVFERILLAEVRLQSGSALTNAVGTITIRDDGGTPDFTTIAPGERAVRVLFYDSQTPTGSPVDRYEKIYAKNNHGTLSLTNATIACTADPDTVIEWGFATGSAQSTTNRLTAPSSPSSVTFITTNAATQIPAVSGEVAAAGVLAAGEASGLWIKQTLSNSTGALKSTFTLQIVGSST